ncbi:hypothetical protein TWF730_000826 [Orbilia blumenaviensis]|uniref:Peptidase C14 caspase domain-containing protein n=1 Tax=Orbilia blumenaviensis TaxID=1796055 RepID=A0AAV9VMT9_9PEZI
MEAKKWAILIGIDHYISGTSRPEIDFHNLEGAVEDVRQVEDLLRTSFGVEDSYIYRLTATNPGRNLKEPLEPPSEWPTYENIVAAFEEVTEKAEQNDLVYIHYSGHGARVSTVFHDLKPNNIDEALVPTDICSGGRYIRDVEIAYLLEKMADKGLIATLVLDCCHSGGANRGPYQDWNRTRGIADVDTAQLESDPSTLASRDELDETWRRSKIGCERTVRIENHWLLGTRRYTFIAACRTDEYAKEDTFNGKVQGLLTHTLIKTLKTGFSSSNFTYYELWNQVAMNVRKHNAEQNVIMSGEADRIFFGSDRREIFYMVPITDVTKTEGRIIVKMNIGEAQGIHEGTGIDVWPSSRYDFKPSERVALLRVTKIEDCTLEAEVEWSDASKGDLEAGFLARPHAVPRRSVQLVDPLSTYQDAMAEARKALNQHKIPISDGAAAPAFFRVHVKDESYVILGDDDKELRNSVPPLDVRVEGAAENLARRITHLTQYYNILDLRNAERDESNEWLSVSLKNKPRGFPVKPRIARDQPGPIALLPSMRCETAAGEWLLLKVKNMSGVALYIIIVDLDSTWAIDQIYPYEPGTVYQILEPDQTLYLPLEVAIPDGAMGIVDTIKVFATTEPTSFRWLELPKIASPNEGNPIRGREFRPKNALEVLQKAITQDISRKVSVSVYIPSGWDTVDCTIETPTP